MDLDVTIAGLIDANGPSRTIDEAISLLAGYKKSDSGSGSTSSRWVNPTGKVIPRAPRFTGSVQQAYELSQILFAEEPIAVSWNGNGHAFAQYAEAEPCYGQTQAIAICLAILRRNNQAVK